MQSNSQDFVDVVINMLTTYDRQLQTENPIRSPEEFVKNNFCEKQLFVENMQEKCITIFFEICSLRSFLDAISKDDLLPSSPAGLVHIYLLLFYASPSNHNIIAKSLSRQFDQYTIENILKFLTQKDLLNIVKQKCMTSSCLPNQQEGIIKEVKERMEIFHKIYYENERKTPRAKSDICGIDFEEAHMMLLDYNDEPNAIDNNYEGSIWSARSRNGSQKNQLPKQHNSLKSSGPSPKFHLDLSLPLGCPPSESRRTRRMQKIDEEPFTANSRLTTRRSRVLPEIKKTTAQVLRDGARVQKKAEEAEKIFKDLCNGSIDPYISAKLLDEVRQQENAMEMRDIERKHLLGLLSREEARIAKSTVIAANRMKALELKRQSQEREGQLQEYRRLEMIRMREIAEKNQFCLEQARLAQVNLLNKRKMTAKQIQEESRQLQRKIDEQRKQELEQKISLIRQIKELEQLSKDSKSKESSNGPACSDTRSQAPSIGVDCQMSVTQLKDALVRVKDSVKEQVERRRERIQFEHIRHERLIQENMRRIERYKNVPKLPKLQIAGPCKEVKPTPELLRLRKKLELKRLQAASVCQTARRT